MGMKLRARVTTRCAQYSRSHQHPKDGKESHNFCTNEFTEVCMLPMCRLQLLPRPRVFIALDFNQVHMPLFHIWLMGLPHAVGCCDPLCGAVPAA
eukprot:490275-Pelagomonas_calceolata.AAC.1